jgi:GNAT superfamily N-acetyltransferase
MQQGIRIRPVNHADFEPAFSLLERFFAEEGFGTAPDQIRTQLEEMLANDESAVFLAWVNDKAVGVATVTTTQGIELGHSAELEDLYVLPEARGCKVGGALIEAVKDWCRPRGCRVVSVVVTPEGQAAHNLIDYYRAHGFEESGRTILFSHLEQPGRLNPANRQAGWAS